jgi:biotin transporter BioY
MAEYLFAPFRLIGLFVGALLAVIIYTRSKKRKHIELLWNTLIVALAAFGVILIVYTTIFYFIPTPQPWMMIVEATLYSALYIFLSMFIIVLLLTAPNQLFSRAKNLLHWFAAR